MRTRPGRTQGQSRPLVSRGRRSLRRVMARIPYPEPDEQSDRVKEALGRLPPLNVFRVLSHAETAFRPYLRFGGALLAALELQPVPRELAILQVARVFEAEYEWIQHVAIGRAVGVTDAQIQGLERGDPDGASSHPPRGPLPP